MTRDGKTSVLRATKADWGNPRFSPDGQKLAIDISDGKQRDIWVYEWARDTLTQLTFDPGEDRNPVWTPDGRRIVFASDRAKPGVSNLYWVNADGTGEVTRLTDSPDNQVPWSWHPSGKFLGLHAIRGATLVDLMILPMEGDAARGWTPGKPTVFLSTPATEAGPMFSPDGRWIAYVSTEAGGGFDVYVRPFPRARRKMARLHGRRHLSPVVGHDARTAVPEPGRHSGRSWPHRTPSSAMPSAPRRRRSGRRPAFSVRPCRIVRTISIRTASGSRLLRARTRAASFRTRSSSSSTSPTTCRRSRHGANDASGRAEDQSCPYRKTDTATHEGAGPGLPLLVQVTLNSAPLRSKGGAGPASGSVPSGRGLFSRFERERGLRQGRPTSASRRSTAAPEADRSTQSRRSSRRNGERSEDDRSRTTGLASRCPLGRSQLAPSDRLRAAFST